MWGIQYSNRDIAVDQSDLGAIAQHMYPLMMRNIATADFVFADPNNPGSYSKPGCVLAAPSYPSQTPGVDQDYVYNWVRDAAITAMEVTAAKPMVRAAGGVQSLMDY